MNHIRLKNKLKMMALAGTLSSAVLCSGCGNRKALDEDKPFNVAIETNNGFVSIVGIKEYTTYSSSLIQFRTEDGLKVMTSTGKTQFLKTTDEAEAQKYALSLCGNEERFLIDYNDMQGISINTDLENWDRALSETTYSFNRALILIDDKATIVDLVTWDYWEEMGTIQLELNNEMGISASMDTVKLINDEEASEDSLESYAISLVGSKENIQYYASPKIKNI